MWAACKRSSCYPDDAEVGRFDLAMAGHTHAGQACVPFTEVCPFLEEDMKPYRYGLYDWPSGGKLYVSSGLGTSAVRTRIGARPEVAVLDLAPRSHHASRDLAATARNPMRGAAAHVWRVCAPCLGARGPASAGPARPIV